MRRRREPLTDEPYLQEKRFRSMQEHIRRAHAEHYIPKLPATEESFLLMVNTLPKARPSSSAPLTATAAPPGREREETKTLFHDEHSSGDPLLYNEVLRRPSLLPAATAAAALASLHHQRGAFDWDSDADATSDPEGNGCKPCARFAGGVSVRASYYAAASLPPHLLPSSLSHSSSTRSSTLPPSSSAVKPARPRKASVGQNGRRGKHERSRSKDHIRRLSHDRKACSAEPAAVAAIMGKRWEDLIDAAASATEEGSRDLTPVPQSPRQSPRMMNRTSLPPLFSSQLHSHAASPLQSALTTPPRGERADLQPFPSVESSIESTMSGQNFHVLPQALADSSPTSPFPVQIYCAACRKLSILRDSYACTECVCGLCQECVDVLISEHTRGRSPRCPRCNAIGGRFKPFQLDIR